MSNVDPLPCRPEILKHEMKVFFVKYNDPIYVKLEKLDIMIRLASQANIAQVTVSRRQTSSSATHVALQHMFEPRNC